MNESLMRLNERLNSWECFFSKQILQSLPVAVGLPTGDKCNLQCIFCTERNGKEDKYKNISFSDFLAFKEALPFAASVQIQGWGEPLINPDFMKIFDYVAQNCKGAQISFNTNGILLDGQWVDRLLSSGNIRINISLNASTRETYKELTGKDYFDKVISNIRYLTKKLSELNSRSFHFSVSMVCMTQNIQELPQLVDLAADLDADSVVLRDLMVLKDERKNDSLYFHKDKTVKALKEAFDTASRRRIELDVSSFPVAYFFSDPLKAYFEPGMNMPYSYIPISSPLPPEALSVCHDPWRSLIVSTFGDVMICCHSKSVMGNLFEKSLNDIWNGEGYRYFRRYVNTSTPPEDCKTCIKKLYNLSQCCLNI